MILVVCPLPPETKALRPFARDGLRVETGAHGKVAFALAAERLIRAHRPSLLICAGTGGALAPELRPGDVVIGTHTIEHDYNLKFVHREPPRFAGCPATLARLRGLGPPGAHFGAIASGDEDVIDRGRAGEIFTKTGGALAVAWEGAGAARAAQARGLPFLEIRAITDAADADAARDFELHLERGMRAIGTVLARL